jgi:UDP-N-acetylglucosamine 2-epimerase
VSTVRIISVVGARPQFIKAAAVSRAVASAGESGLREQIVHTGQHYDDNMSRVFFDELKIPRPAVNLGVGSGPHGRQTGLMLERLEEILLDEPPDWMLIYGDTNSTLAGALAAVKLHIPVAHVEAGLRSFNRRMPEEINRVVADCVSTVLFCPTDTAVENLRREGVIDGVHKVGDVMYDSVLFNARLAEESSNVVERLGLEPKGYFLATVHRAENTDDRGRLEGILSAFGQLDRPVVLPLHPRTRKAISEHGLEPPDGLRMIDPAAYLDMVMLERQARLILTDSGGVQKEAYWFDVPCVTLRDETEWVELVSAGCNRVVGADEGGIVSAVREWETRDCALPDERPGDLYGDGHSAEHIVSVLAGR